MEATAIQHGQVERNVRRGESSWLVLGHQEFVLLLWFSLS